MNSISFNHTQRRVTFMKKQQLAALCLAAGLALTGITSPVSAAQTGTGISMSANSTDTTGGSNYSDKV